MEFPKFEELTLLDCEAHETEGKLWEIIEAMTPEKLTVSWADRRTSFHARGVSAIIDPQLMALDMDFDDEAPIDADGHRVRIPAKNCSGDDLIKLVQNGDDTTHVLFIPQARYKWFHRDDDLDYAFEQHRNGDNDGSARDFTQWMKFGPYPFSNFLMDPRDGRPLEWVFYGALDRTYPEGWAPSVPSEIRWYTKELGLLDDAGVNQLRPMIAQWWT